MKLYPPTLLPPSLLASRLCRSAQTPTSEAEPPAPLIEPTWQRSYQRWQSEAPVPGMPALAPLMPAVTPEPAEAPAQPPSLTAQRVMAMHQSAEAADVAIPAPRSWHLDLPGAGPAWQLRVEQALPGAPLNLQLHVPPIAHGPARQQLHQLDKRLREAGYAVQGLRCDTRTRADRHVPPQPLDEMS